MEGGSDSNKGVYITNVVMAKGAVELYERNATDYSSAVEKAIAETGKFVTNNILFETGKATLKPESMEEIEKVADYMKKNPNARFEVQGHRAIPTTRAPTRSTTRSPSSVPRPSSRPSRRRAWTRSTSAPWARAPMSPWPTTRPRKAAPRTVVSNSSRSKRLWDCWTTW